MGRFEDAGTLMGRRTDHDLLARDDALDTIDAHEEVIIAGESDLTIVRDQPLVLLVTVLLIFHEQIVSSLKCALDRVLEHYW